MKSMHSVINSTIFWCTFALLTALVLSPPLTHAQSFQEGEDYVTLQGDATILPDGRVEVIEFFWFGCPSCFQFEPYLQAWQKPNTVHFVTIPGVLHRSSEFHARVYYAMELLDLEQELMTPFYDALHVNRIQVRNVAELKTWLATLPGVNAEKMAATMNSFAANTKVAQAELLANRYGVSGTPNLVVGGKYRTSPAMAKSFPRTLQVVEHLVEKILTEQ